jgi:putative aldouronate transport system permease protein
MTMGERLKKEWSQNKEIYFLLIPVVAFYLLFCYKPMYGALIAFQNYTPGDSVIGGKWVGFKHFISFFKSYYFWRLIRNTLTISITDIIFGFPAPIILALLMNELRSKVFSRVTQAIVYLPHFISMVVICGMLKDFVKETGIISILLSYVGMEPQNMLQNAKMFVPLYVGSDIWKGIGWGSIIYLAALTAVDQEQYEAAQIDGAGRWKQTLHITIPAIIPTIVIMFIMRTGSVLSVGSEKVLLLYNPTTYETADVISTFVYRKGILEGNFSYSTAIGLFNSVVNFALVFAVNKISGKVSETSLW